MPSPNQIRSELSLGLIVLGVMSCLALLFVWRAANAPQEQKVLAPLAPKSAMALLGDTPGIQSYLDTLSKTNPGLSARFVQAAPLLPNDYARRVALLETSLTVMKQEAPYMRYARLGAFTDLLIALDVGMSDLAAAESPWCQATSIADLTRRNETDLMPYLLSAFAADDAAFSWVIGFADIALNATLEARTSPTRHGRRTQQDEAIVQFYGRQIGVERLPVALSVAAFSHAEGRSFATMQEAIDGVDVCELADAFVELSDRLPNDLKGRVLAELAPEMFYGNTPYVLYLFRGYFFIG